MRRQLVLTFAMACLVGIRQPAAAQKRAAPFYTLPPDGTWIEFEFKARDPGGRERAGVLRISSVGSVQIGGTPHRWVEVKREWRHGTQSDYRVRKLLIAEKAFAAGQAPDRYVVEAFAQDRPGAAMVPLTAERVTTLLNLGIDGVLAPRTKVGELVDVATRLGTFRARHVSARGKIGARALQYQGWLSDEVPFGCVKFTIQEQVGGKPANVLFSAVAARRGQGAKGVLDAGKGK